MPFVTIPGLKGKVYVPESDNTGKKHPCRDCFSCQHCSDDRCAVCRTQGKNNGQGKCCRNCET